MRLETFRSMIGELNPDQIEQVLHEQVIGRIGCHADGRTYVVPTTYVYDGDSIVCHTGLGLKVHMMRVNPNVCFEVEDLRNLPRWKSVVVQGHYDELRGADADAALENLRARLQAGPPSEELMPREGSGVFVPQTYEERAEIVFRIVIDDVKGRYEA